MRVDLTREELDTINQAINLNLFETENELKSIEETTSPLSDIEDSYYASAEREYNRLSAIAKKLQGVKDGNISSSN